MDKIIIYNESKTEILVMPRVKGVQVGAKEESRKTVMANGKTVKDILGHRVTVSASWDFLPAGLAARLVTLLRENSFLWVEYPSPTGAASGWFEIDYPSMKVFRYRNGEAVWHDVTLQMTAKEVV